MSYSRVFWLLVAVAFSCHSTCSATLVFSLEALDLDTIQVKVTNNTGTDVTAAQFVAPINFTGPDSSNLTFSSLDFLNGFGSSFGGSLQTAGGSTSPPLTLTSGGLVEVSGVSAGGALIASGTSLSLVNVNLTRAGGGELTAALQTTSFSSADSDTLGLTVAPFALLEPGTVSGSQGSVTIVAVPEPSAALTLGLVASLTCLWNRGKYKSAK